MIRPTASLVFILFLASCGAGDHEEAIQYYDDFSAIIMPYKEGTERIMTESQSLLQEQLKSSGNIKLSHDDSVRQRLLLSEFQSLVKTTISRLNDMDELDGSELKRSGIRWVETSSRAIIGAYRDVALPMQDDHAPPDSHLMDSLSQQYSDDLVNSNDRFAESQLQFLKEFGLLEIQ